MKVKAVISAALLCAFAISASGCDGADIGTDNLIRPPKTARYIGKVNAVNIGCV